MTDIEWSKKLEYKDRMGNELKVLQRVLKNLEKAKENELKPFFQEPSLFRLRMIDTQYQREVKGILKDICFDAENTRVIISDFASQHKFNIGKTKRILLTVYRVNDVLDTIQVNVSAGRGCFYMQTGGLKLLEIFADGEENESPQEETGRIVQIFNHNVLCVP